MQSNSRAQLEAELQKVLADKKITGAALLFMHINEPSKFLDRMENAGNRHLKSFAQYFEKRRLNTDHCGRIDCDQWYTNYGKRHIDYSSYDEIVRLLNYTGELISLFGSILNNEPSNFEAMDILSKADFSIKFPRSAAIRLFSISAANYVTDFLTYAKLFSANPEILAQFEEQIPGADKTLQTIATKEELSRFENTVNGPGRTFCLRQIESIASNPDLDVYRKQMEALCADTFAAIRESAKVVTQPAPQNEPKKDEPPIAPGNKSPDNTPTQLLTTDFTADSGTLKEGIIYFTINEETNFASPEITATVNKDDANFRGITVNSWELPEQLQEVPELESEPEPKNKHLPIRYRRYADAVAADFNNALLDAEENMSNPKLQLRKTGCWQYYNDNINKISERLPQAKLETATLTDIITIADYAFVGRSDADKQYFALHCLLARDIKIANSLGIHLSADLCDYVQRKIDGKNHTKKYNNELTVEEVEKLSEAGVIFGTADNKDTIGIIIANLKKAIINDRIPVMRWDGIDEAFRLSATASNAPFGIDHDFYDYAPGSMNHEKKLALKRNATRYYQDLYR